MKTRLRSITDIHVGSVIVVYPGAVLATVHRVDRDFDRCLIDIAYTLPNGDKFVETYGEAGAVEVPYNEKESYA